jgi:hypothetical protein
MTAMAFDLNWLHPDVEARPAGVKGTGSYARRAIPAGATVAAFGGSVVTRDHLDLVSEDRRSRSIQIDEHLYLLSSEHPEPGDMVNHSCDPSCGLMGSNLVVAMRDLEPGDEITFDYAMCDGSDYDEFICGCESEHCRGLITGADWLRPELQQRYDGWFSSYLARRIAAFVQA